MIDSDDLGQTSIVPVGERTIEFYGDEIVAALVEHEGEEPKVYVPLRPLCDYLGLDWSAQLKRTRRDEVLRDYLISVVITTTEIGIGKGRRELTCLELEQLPGWLFTISARRVKPELRKKIILYRRQCFKVLWQAFQTDTFQEKSTNSSTMTSLANIKATGQAIAELAEQQMELEQRVSNHDQRLDKASEVVKNLRERLKEVEKKLTPPSYISSEQAAIVSNEVKALAEYLGNKDKSKNHYASVFGAIYKNFGVSSYKLIRQGQFEAVLKFLSDWRKSVDNTGKLLPPSQQANKNQPQQLDLFNQNFEENS